MMFKFIIITVFALSTLASALEQTAQLAPAQLTSPPTHQTTALPNVVAPMPQVIDAKSVGPELGLGESMIVTFADMDEWRKTHKNADLILYLDGHPISNVTALAGPTAEKVVFHLEWGQESGKDWAAVMGRPQFASRQVRVQVGAKDQPPFPGTHSLPLVTLSGKWFSVFAVAFVLLLSGFLMVARSSDLLREGAIAPAVGRRPYSLGRTQMAIWFFVVVAAFMFIWIVTGTYQPLTPSVLGLIGISAGTALGAAMIDSNKQAAVDNLGKSLDAERLQLETEMASLNTTIAEARARIVAAIPGTDVSGLKDQLTKNLGDVALKQERRSQIQQQLQAVGRTVMPRASRRFLDDILSDENGVSFHRFQIAVWTLVLVVIFGFVVYDTLGMPNFDEKLLALMGISSGTYLGFKFPETQ